MERTQIMTNNVKEIRSAKEISNKVTEIAEKISADYVNSLPLIVCILRGSSVFMADLTRKLSINVYIDFMVVTRYGQSSKGGQLRIIKDLERSIEGMDVIIVEDIIDEGITLKQLKQEFEKRKPASLKICSLFDKPANRIENIESDYKGFILPDEFVVGYGMDYKQLYRNIPYLGVIQKK